MRSRIDAAAWPGLRLMPTKRVPHPSAFFAEGGTRNPQLAAGSILTMAMKAVGPGCEVATPSAIGQPPLMSSVGKSATTRSKD
jgi:hypothetical protein